jgi:two-component system OmpR family response regulator/two-component system response regulator QseB
MRILLVEDDPSLADGIATALQREGYAVDPASTGAQALRLARGTAPDLVVLDLGLPDIDGVALLKQLRTFLKAPVLILTARDAIDEKIRGLDAGADDYLTKPFNQAELFARLRALERRTAAGDHTSSELSVGRITLNLATHVVHCDGVEVVLSRREFSLLRALMERPGRVLSREQLEQKLYSWGDEVSSNTIDVHIHNLRKKLYPEFIRTIRGVGYLLPADSGAP